MRKDQENERLSWTDVKLSWLGDYAKLALFPITEPIGIVYQCEKGCRTPYGTPMRWYVTFTVAIEKFAICPVCKTPYIKMLGLHRVFSQEKYHWIWDVERSQTSTNRPDNDGEEVASGS